jgi:arylsulfatase
MKKQLCFSVLLLFMLSCQQVTETAGDTGNDLKSPNILLVMVDDMGWSDIGPYGGEISTPNLDKLARQGIIFTDFHASISCSPTRSMLLSGTDNHLTGLGNMGELLAPNQVGKPGYEGHLNNNVVSLAEVLKDAGYHTFMAGKWHLGHDLDNIPGARGFEKSLSLLFGGGSHFSDMAGIMESENPVEYSMNEKKIKELPADFYSSRSYTDFLIDAIRGRESRDKPFFAYLAFTAPHDPLHVPEPWMSRYRGVYDEGYERLRENRVRSVKELNLLPAEAKVPDFHPSVPDWDSYSERDQAFEARKMEVYAGMIDNIDYHLGRMLGFLEDINELENTIVLFLSDNGSNPWSNEQYPGNEDGIYLSQFDNRIENLGNPTSHMAYGIGWASASSGPLDYFKMAVGEGGIRVPLIISGPKLPQGEIHRNFAYVTDLMPTILELAGVEHPKTYKGNDVLPMEGRSLVKVLSGAIESAYAPHEYIGGEMGNGKWMRKGDYKAEWVVPPYGPNEWRLYDVLNDPGETTDLSATYPEILEDLIAAWDTYAERVGVVMAEKRIQ